MNRKMLIGLGALGLLLVGGAAYAMGHGGHGRMMKHMISARIEDAEDAIEATPQQRVAIEQSKATVFKAFEARAQGRQQTHAQVIELLTADKLDPAALYQIADQHAADIQEMAKVIVPEVQKIHDLLTPAQRQKLAELARKHAGHMQGGGFGGPPGE